MTDELTLQERVRRFNLGTPTPMHQGTYDLVNELWREVERLQGIVENMREIRTTRNVGSRPAADTGAS